MTTAKQNVFKNCVQGVFLCCFSAVSLWLAFPKTDIWPLSWVGLVPLMFALRGKNPLASFFMAYFCGLVFFSGTLYWFVHVTKLGAVLIVMYCAVYFGLFGLGYNYFRDKTIVVKMFLIPAVWVIFEFLRANLFTGFGWAGLGQSQYKNLPMIQIADITGTYGISFLIVMVNVVWERIFQLFLEKKSVVKEKGMLKAVCLALCLLALTWGYGMKRLSEEGGDDGLSIAVVQGNIPQELKWHEFYWPDILAKYQILTQQAALENPDLIIWPETSFPGYIGEHEDLFEKLKNFTKEVNIPLLFGAVVKQGERYFNSAVLLSNEGGVLEQYNKIHLVPFGEYIPFRRFFPFLSQIVPIADFESGAREVLFPFPSSRSVVKYFSVLICFEDTVPRLSRMVVQRGAQLLINVTNDAWFQDTKAPFLHLQAAVFRSIENRRALVRSTNTGVSCFIDPYGRIVKAVEDVRQKKTYVLGHAVNEVPFRSQMTFYTRLGDIFTYLCFGGLLAVLLLDRYGSRIFFC